MRIAIVGSGASAVHFAQTVLERGHEVTMLDVGREGTRPVRPADSYEDLKRNLEDPAAHFLGSRFEAVTYPGMSPEHDEVPFELPHAYERAVERGIRAEGIAPRLSFARGGLGETWNGAVPALRPEEAVDFPFPFEDLAAAYDTVAARIGVSGIRDDLEPHMPAPRELRAALPLDEHSALLLERYDLRRDVLRRDGVALGRTRLAVLPSDDAGRKGCTLLGRCRTGCPTESLYTPSLTLRALLGRTGFEYRSGRRVTHLRADESRRVRAVVCRHADGGAEEEVTADRVVLAAGALSSARIFLETWRRATGESPRLTGLLDNRQVLVPFLTWQMIRRPHDPRTFPYPQLALVLEGFSPCDDVHALVATLKAGAIHPIVGSLPGDFRSALRVFRDVHAALGRVEISFPDRRRARCWVELGASAGDDEAPLTLHYEPPTGERARIGRAVARVRAALRELGAVALPFRTRVRPMGAAAHYAGLLPMTREARPFTTTPDGASRDLADLTFADGTTLPFLPAKDPGFTLMANAVRIGRRLG